MRPLQRWITLVLGVAVVVLAVVVVMKSRPSQGAAPSVSSTSKSADAGASADAGTSANRGFGFSDADVVDLPGQFGIEARQPIDGGIGWTMADGTPVPPLGANAPRQVKVGGVLVIYAGAEAAPKSARSKAEARALADKLDAQAKADFHSAVRDGDQGLAFDEIGIIYRGSLEPAVEYAVFSLEPGSVSDVLETPRGYWIVRRIE